MIEGVEIFKEEHPSLESYWRSIILFGRNVASYKFAFGKTLFEFIAKDKTVITLEELSEPFSRYLCEHLVDAKQTTSQSSKFLDACRSFNDGELTKEQLVLITSKLGFNYVIDAFHIVNTKNIHINFFKKDYNNQTKRIILTDEIYKLKDLIFFRDLNNEIEARWKLVETAWELGISRNLLNVQYNKQDEMLSAFVGNSLKRKSVTSAKDALNGYQKGKCFYCFTDITINSNSEMFCDVDHFFPHVLLQAQELQRALPQINLDGVWNLVLACPKCNRGTEGKFSHVPATKYLQRIYKRNEFLISSHHPLRETLMQQTGDTEINREAFLKKVYFLAINSLIHQWETEQIGEEIF